jgi:FkbM family methyltransferase
MKLHSTKVSPFEIWYQQSEEFHRLKSEVFAQGAYYFESNNPQPRILDGGAHLGLSTLYFKKLFSGAQITAIEPNPAVLPLLEKNIWENQLQDVKVEAVALADTAGFANFYLDSSTDQWYSTAGFHAGAWNGEQRSRVITVPTQKLDHYLAEPIDFLKLDIEGAEQKVLQASQLIHKVKHMMVEFHPHSTQSLPELLEWLRRHDFKLQLWKDGRSIPEQKAKGLLYIEAWQEKTRVK